MQALHVVSLAKVNYHVAQFQALRLVNGAGVGQHEWQLKARQADALVHPGSLNGNYRNGPSLKSKIARRPPKVAVKLDNDVQRQWKGIGGSGTSISTTVHQLAHSAQRASGKRQWNGKVGAQHDSCTLLQVDGAVQAKHNVFKEAGTTSSKIGRNTVFGVYTSNWKTGGMQMANIVLIRLLIGAKEVQCMIKKLF